MKAKARDFKGDRRKKEKSDHFKGNYTGSLLFNGKPTVMKYIHNINKSKCRPKFYTH